MGRALYGIFALVGLYQKLLTCSLRSLVQFLTHHQLVRKYRTRALPMK